MTTELHVAWCWDCDECGHENFERAIEGNVDEAALMADENQITGFMAAPNAKEREDGMMESELLQLRVALFPSTVTCENCKLSFPTELLEYDEDDV